MAKHFSTLVLVLGLALVAGSFVWKQTHSTWTPEQAANYTQAANDLEQLGYLKAQTQDLQSKSPADAQKAIAEKQLSNAADASGPIDPKTATPERIAAAFADAKKRYDESRAALDQVRTNGEGAASILRWLGVALAAAGLAGLAIFRSRDA